MRVDGIIRAERDLYRFRQRTGRCVLCGVRHDEKTVGCSRCYLRHWHRAKA